MAAGLNMKFTTSSGSTVDLTSVSVNSGAAPESTPRQGGFTLRNRVNFSNVAAANKKTFTFDSSASNSGASQAANKFRVLSVPVRTLVKGPVRVFAVESQTIPGHAVASATTAADLNSALAAGVIGFSGDAYKKKTSGIIQTSIVYNADATFGGSSTTEGAALGRIPIQKADAGTLAIFEGSMVEAVDASMTKPWLGQVMLGGTGNGAVGTGSAVYPGGDMYFPHGGFVTMALGPSGVALGAMASSKGKASAKGMVGSLSGVWEIQAECQYIPE